jgi:hypothetical protein
LFFEKVSRPNQLPNCLIRVRSFVCTTARTGWVAAFYRRTLCHLPNNHRHLHHLTLPRSKILLALCNGFTKQSRAPPQHHIQWQVPTQLWAFHQWAHAAATPDDHMPQTSLCIRVASGEWCMMMQPCLHHPGHPCKPLISLQDGFETRPALRHTIPHQSTGRL